MVSHPHGMQLRVPMLDLRLKALTIVVLIFRNVTLGNFQLIYMFLEQARYLGMTNTVYGLCKWGDESSACFCVCSRVCSECLALWDRTGNVCCAWLTKSRAPGAASCVYPWTKAAWGREMFHHTRSDHLHRVFKLLLPLPLCQIHWSTSFSLSPSIHHHHSLPLPSAQSYHTGSLFLANLFLIHYWDLFFFLESQNEEKGTDLLNF